MPEVSGLERNKPVDPSWVELVHDGIDGSFRAAPSAVAHWERRGWTVSGRAEAPANARPNTPESADRIPAEQPADPAEQPASQQADQAAGVEAVQVVPAEGDTQSPARRR
jgi:hypothetical protein